LKGWSFHSEIKRLAISVGNYKKNTHRKTVRWLATANIWSSSTSGYRDRYCHYASVLDSVIPPLHLLNCVSCFLNIELTHFGILAFKEHGQLFECRTLSLHINEEDNGGLDR
jgi:hypothetical protein